MRIPVRNFGASTLDCYRELLDQDPSAFTEDDRDLVTLLQSWSGRSIAVTDATRESIRSALTDLANGEDEIAEDRNVQRRDPERARYSRRACRGLSAIRCG